LDGSEPTITSTGKYFQGYRFSAQCYQEELDLRRFPFHSINLPLAMETRPAPFSMEAEAILLKPEIHYSTLLGDYVNFNGYKLRGPSIKPFIHRYRTTFGEEHATVGGNYSTVIFSADYITDYVSAFYKYVMPWLIIMLIIIMAPSLDGKLGEVRLAIPSTMLLTLVFLQQSARENIPQLEYTTFLDELYLYGFMASMVLFAIFVCSSNLYDQAKNQPQGAIAKRIDRVEAIFQVATIVGILIFLGNFCFFR
jgi:hypothetical protein